MSLHDRLEADINRVFLNETQFATWHSWEGTQILCVVDNDLALKRKNNNVVDISWDPNSTEILLYAKESDFARKPHPQQTVMFDRTQYTVMQVSGDAGILEILLSGREGKMLP